MATTGVATAGGKARVPSSFTLGSRGSSIMFLAMASTIYPASG